MKCGLVVALAGFGVAFAAAPCAAQNRAWPAEIECRGPLARVVLECGAAGRATVEGELIAGESRRMTVFLPVRSVHERGTPRLEFDATGDVLERGSVRFVRWLERDANAVVLPPALRARTRPPVGESAVTARPLALAVVVVAAALVIALRRRPGAAVAVGIAGGGLAAVLGARATPPPPQRIEVVDALVDLRERRSVVAASGAIELPLAGTFDLVVEPLDAPLHLAHDFARPNVVAQAPGRTLWIDRAFEADAPIERSNPFGDLEQCWWREEGAWTYRGAWNAGASLPAEADGPPAPGWLSSALPQGPTVLVGRRAGVTGGLASFVRVAGR